MFRYVGRVVDFGYRISVSKRTNQFNRNWADPDYRRLSMMFSPSHCLG